MRIALLFLLVFTTQAHAQTFTKADIAGSYSFWRVYKNDSLQLDCSSYKAFEHSLFGKAPIDTATASAKNTDTLLFKEMCKSLKLVLDTSGKALFYDRNGKIENSANWGFNDYKQSIILAQEQSSNIQTVKIKLENGRILLPVAIRTDPADRIELLKDE